MGFIEYKTTRVKKPQEELTSSKNWQPQARRLYIPLETKKYGLEVKEWTEEVTKNGKPAKKKCHAITWKHKPYAKLLINSDKKARAILQLQINTSDGLAIQVDPANHKRFYVSIPKGALASLPDVACDLAIGIQDSTSTFTYSKK